MNGDDEDENDDGNDHLLPYLGEGLENGGQVGVLGRVQVPSNMVHHLKSDFWKSNKDAVIQEGKSSKSLPYCLISSKLANCPMC